VEGVFVEDVGLVGVLGVDCTLLVEFQALGGWNVFTLLSGDLLVDLAEAIGLGVNLLAHSLTGQEACARTKQNTCNAVLLCSAMQTWLV
jgi:hypothetical protein